MSLLHTPFTLPNGTIARNRFFKAAMSEQLARRNAPTERLVKLYETWARGGAGILVTGNVMVDYTALGAANDVVIEDERDMAVLQRWARAGTQDDTLLLMQINHPGKQSTKELSPEPVAPSAVPIEGPLAPFFKPPRALSADEIRDIIQRFGNAAAIAEKAGFSGVQIHAAHGYLVSQFLSPHHNRRSDEWGGSLDNRMRFLLEIFREIRHRTSPAFIVSVKLNSADFQKGGFSEEESVQAVKILSDIGVDLIEISGGNYEAPAMLEGVKESTRKREAYFLDYAARARAVSAVPLAVTGGFRSAQVMENALESGSVDFVGLAKPFAVQPDLPARIIAGTYQTLDLPPRRTGIGKLDSTIGSVLEMNWYMYQMERIGKGQPTRPNFSVWALLARMLIRNGTSAFGRERA